MRATLPNTKGGDVFIEQRHWLALTTGTLGQDIRAYRPDGKLAAPREVLNALAKPRGVAYFLGYDKAKPVIVHLQGGRRKVVLPFLSPTGAMESMTASPSAPGRKRPGSEPRPATPPDALKASRGDAKQAVPKR